jgi:hypothetical protein
MLRKHALCPIEVRVRLFDYTSYQAYKDAGHHFLKVTALWHGQMTSLEDAYSEPGMCAGPSSSPNRQMEKALLLMQERSDIEREIGYPDAEKYVHRKAPMFETNERFARQKHAVYVIRRWTNWIEKIKRVKIGVKKAKKWTY